MQFHDTMTINITYTFPATVIRIYGAVLGMETKHLPSGGVINLYNVWNVNGELEIQSGAVLNYGGQLSNMLRNHGLVNWNGGSINACGDICTFINETDGEFVIAGIGYLARTNLTNYGLITKSTADNIHFNGGCGNDGYFNNVSPGVVNNITGLLDLQGDGVHSGTFNNNGTLVFNADHDDKADNLQVGRYYLRYAKSISLHFSRGEITSWLMIGWETKHFPREVLNMNSIGFGSELVIADGPY
jgi:hypothetical protein